MDLASLWPDLYTSGFATATFALLLWNAYARRWEVAAFAPVLVAAGLVVMVSSLTFTEATISEKLLVLSRDLLLQACSAYVIRTIAKYPRFTLPAILALAVVYGVFYRKVQAEGLDPVPPRVEASAQQAESQTYEMLVVGEPSQATLGNGVSLVQAFTLNGEESAHTAFLQNVFAVDVHSDQPEEVASVRERLLQAGFYAEDNEHMQVAPLQSNSQGALVGPQPKTVGLNDPEVKQLWAFTAWEYAAFAKTSLNRDQKLNPARLFVLDTGVDGKHPDLAANYESYRSEFDTDVVGHGTHVAGIAAAVANNGLGIAGWWPVGDHPITVSSIRVFNPLGFATQRAVVQGILDASAAGAAVINLSLGGPTSDAKQRIYEEAVAVAAARGAIVVVSAGNSNVDARGFSPANTSGVLVVGAINNQLEKAYFSNTIDRMEMSVWAPGEDIYSLVPSGGYTKFSGTSMAAPQVAGLLTYAKALKPDLTTQQAYDLLRQTVMAPQQQGETTVIDPAKFIEELLR